MAELSTPTSSCCAPEAQETCCEQSDKDACCGTSVAGGSCGCAAGKAGDAEIREKVRERYAAAATAVAESTSSGCCGAPAAIDGCGPAISSRGKQGKEVFGAILYDGEGDAAPMAAVEASLGCGVPTAVGPTGEAIGLDMTDEMLELARANAAEASSSPTA